MPNDMTPTKTTTAATGATPATFHLPPGSPERLTKLARERGISPNEVLAEALDCGLKRLETNAPPSLAEHRGDVIEIETIGAAKPYEGEYLGDDGEHIVISNAGTHRFIRKDGLVSAHVKPSDRRRR